MNATQENYTSRYHRIEDRLVPRQLWIQDYNWGDAVALIGIRQYNARLDLQLTLDQCAELYRELGAIIQDHTR